MSKEPREVSDAFWEIAEPLIPRPKRDNNRQYKRMIGGGRKPIEARKVLSAILHVLRAGIQWKALPKDICGSPSAIHRYFKEWEQAGFFLELWRKGLSEHDDMEGIAWEWQSSSDSKSESPLALKRLERGPGSRKKIKYHILASECGGPLSTAAEANRRIARLATTAKQKKTCAEQAYREPAHQGRI